MPIMFPNINDFPDEISFVYMFADDETPIRIIRTEEDCCTLERDLESLQR